MVNWSGDIQGVFQVYLYRFHSLFYISNQSVQVEIAELDFIVEVQIKPVQLLIVTHIENAVTHIQRLDVIAVYVKFQQLDRLVFAVVITSRKITFISIYRKFY